jgi:UDP-N-acetylglucosamine--N-acetylmuramyl-(pentapeptide) pyrophosphoryl-undecaprenol N-acetylglucosamine transferase
VRREIAALGEPAARYAQRGGSLRVLVVGGSQGARALNENLPPALALIPQEVRPQVTHQCGENNRQHVQASYAQLGVEANVVAFIADMASAYAASDLLICRAGALTVAEIAAAGVASVLVPYPSAVDDHQSGNARFLSDAGAAVLLPQSELAPPKLAQLIQSFSRERLSAMAAKARALAKPDATDLLAQACMELAHAA